MRSLEPSIFSFEVVVYITKTQPITTGFVRISRTYTLAGGTYACSALRILAGSIKQTMGGQYQVHLARKAQRCMQVHAAVAFKCTRLFGKKHRVENDAVAYDVDCAFLEYTGGYRAQYKFLVIDFKSVSGIGAALKTCHRSVMRREHIYNFTLAFITPL